MEIRKISESEIAIDTPVVETKVYNIDFLLEQKSRLETELAEVNLILSQIDGVKEAEVKLEKSSMAELVMADVVEEEVVKGITMEEALGLDLK